MNKTTTTPGDLIRSLKYHAENSLVWLHLLNQLAHEYTKPDEYRRFIGTMNDLAAALSAMNGNEEKADVMARRIMAEAQSARDRVAPTP